MISTSNFFFAINKLNLLESCVLVTEVKSHVILRFTFVGDSIDEHTQLITSPQHNHQGRTLEHTIKTPFHWVYYWFLSFIRVFVESALLGH